MYPYQLFKQEVFSVNKTELSSADLYVHSKNFNVFIHILTMIYAEIFVTQSQTSL